MEDNERWKSDGDCTLCRRSKYCSKPCTAVKRASAVFIQEAAERALDKATHGMYRNTIGKIRQQ